MTSPDLYEILGVEPTASADELKRAYRRLARQYHPDANPDDPGAEARFKDISQAYEILSDPERRANYDRFGADVGAGGNPFGAGSVQDIFDMFFGSMGHNPTRRGPQAGPDAEMGVEITLEEAAFGATKEITASLAQRCPTCTGTGAAPGTAATSCGECGGLGEVRRVRNSILGQMMTTSTCPRCGGFGTLIESPCPTCRGDGRTVAPVTMTIQIPAGVEDGSTMRLADRGPAGPRGGPPGRLFVHLRVAPDDRFVRDGDDLHHQAHLAFTQAALGTTVEVPTLRGTLSIEVPAGSAPGAVQRIRHEGVTHLHGRGRGDLYVHLMVDVPGELDEKSEALLRELAAHRGEPVAEPAGGLFRRRSKR